MRDDSKKKLKLSPGGGEAEGTLAIALLACLRFAWIVAFVFLAVKLGATGEWVSLMARIRGP